MRIGLLCDMYEPHVSGVTTSVHELKRSLEALGHEVWVVTFGNLGNPDDEPNVLRSPGISWGATGWHLATSHTAENRRLIASLDVAHLHHPFTSALASLHICRDHGVATVFTAHSRYDLYGDTYAWYVPAALRRAAVRRYLGTLAHRVDRVIAPSRAMADWLADATGFHEARVVPSGVDVGAYRTGRAPQARALLGIPDDALVYCSLGRLAFEKNPDVLLDAFALVAALEPSAWLLLIGDGPAHSVMQRRFDAAGVTSRVVFAGEVAHERLPEVLSAGDVFCSASLTETQGLAALEAMAAGLPAVCVGAPGFEETVHDGIDGLLAENSPEALAKSLLRLAEPGTRTDMSAGARQTAEAHTSMASARAVLGVYAEALEASPRAG